MNELKSHIKNNNLHHAYLIEGNLETTVQMISELLEADMKVVVAGNPDVVIEKYATFTIDDGRELKKRQGEKALQGSKKIFIIQTDFFNIEAQHALLKVFEEPAEGVHFFILTPQVGALLDTLSSRLVHIRSGVTNSTDLISEGKKFLKKTKPERLVEIGKLIKSHEDDEDSGSLRSEAILLLNGIELALHSDADIKKMSENSLVVFEEINSARKYLSIPGASVKMLLEGIALLSN